MDVWPTCIIFLLALYLSIGFATSYFDYDRLKNIAKALSIEESSSMEYCRDTQTYKVCYIKNLLTVVLIKIFFWPLTIEGSND